MFGMRSQAAPNICVIHVPRNLCEITNETLFSSCSLGFAAECEKLDAELAREISISIFCRETAIPLNGRCIAERSYGLANKSSERKATRMRKGKIVNDFLAGGGEMGALTREFDWSKTSLGPPETLAAKSSGYGASRSHLAPPDVHLVGTGTHPVL
jgi:hypothetical protein